MTLHALIEYVKYSLHAKGRHGTHSPFVYDFVEQVTENKITTCKPGSKYEQLLARVREYYDCYVLEFAAHEQEMWPQLLQENKQALRARTIIAVHGIHTTKQHSSTWAALCADTDVKMSIDLYGVGLLICREDFKEKQHFTVKYQAHIL